MLSLAGARADLILSTGGYERFYKILGFVYLFCRKFFFQRFGQLFCSFTALR